MEERHSEMEEIQNQEEFKVLIHYLPFALIGLRSSAS